MLTDADSKTSTHTIKFLCSYNGIILPRSLDGKLRYVGGLTRVLAVHPSIPFAELMVKLGEFCRFSVELKCPLPGGDLETFISIKSDEELAFIIEEYDRRCPGSKIRAVLSPPKSLKTVSHPQSIDLSPTKSKSKSALNAFHYGKFRSYIPPIDYPVDIYGDCGGVRCYPSRLQGYTQGSCCRDTPCFNGRRQ